MPTETDAVFRKLAATLRADQSVVGYFLSGSRGKGFETLDSDYDLVIIAKDGSGPAVRKRYPFRYHRDVDCVVHTLSEFERYAEFGSTDAWNRYSFSHVSVQFDRSGELQKLVDEKGRLPESDRTQFLRDSLDSHLNAAYRSIKRTARGDQLGAKLEAAQSVPYLLDLVFGVEGRHAPFPGYLREELQRFPLLRLPIRSSELIALIESLAAANVSAQQEILRIIEPVCSEEGLVDVIDAWGEDYDWALSFSNGLASPVECRSAKRNDTDQQYVVAVFLPLPDDHWIEDLRGRFDPLARKLPAHITLVHPFESRINEDDLQGHMLKVATSSKAFEVVLRGITGHQHEYLFLNLVRGNDEVIELRDRLYQGPLLEHMDSTRTFIPHVTVGRHKQQAKFRQALELARGNEQTATALVEEIVAYRIDQDEGREVVARAPLGH